MISAVFGIYFAFDGNIRYAIVCLMVSGFCDTFDGRIARLKKRDERELNYGIQIDSMADLISFGALPATIAFAVSRQYDVLGASVVIIAAAYVLATLIRLSFFNAIESETQKSPNNEGRKYFKGLPTTSIALITPVAYSICNLTETYFYSVLNTILVFVSIMFVLNFRIPKPSIRTQIILCLIGLPIVIFILLA